MAYYRLYFLRGSHIRNVEEIDADTDTLALEAAKALACEDGLELWQQNRMIGRIEPNDLGSELLARRSVQRDAPADASEEQFNVS